MPKLSAARMDATRDRILAGARRAFARHGYEGATVRVLEAETGLSRGAIFHHFRDKDALFLALAAQDAEEMAAVVAEGGLVEVMRTLPERDAGWLGVQLEVSRRLRTDPAFRRQWTEHLDTMRLATEQRLARGRAGGAVRDDVPIGTLAAFLMLLHDGLVLHLATGMPVEHAAGILRLAEEAVRRPALGRAAPVSKNLPTATNRRSADDG